MEEKTSPLWGEAGPEEQIRRRQTGVGADMIRPPQRYGMTFVWGAASQTRPQHYLILWGATSSGQSPHRSPRPDGQVSLRSLAPPLPRKALRTFPGPLIARQTTSRPIAILRRKRTGETVQNPFLFPCWKKNGFWNPKKKGLPSGLSGPK